MGVVQKIYELLSSIWSGKKAPDAEYFRNIAESIPQMVWSADAVGKTDYFNKRWFEYFEKKPTYDYDKLWRTFLHPDDLEQSKTMYWKSIRSGTDYEAEYRLRDKNGNYRWFLSRGSPIRDSKNKIIRWLGTATDIHDQKEAIRMREEAIKARDDFISLASHELKTPLTSMLLQIQLHKKLLQKNSQNLSQEKIEKLIKNFDTQVLRLNRLIEDMIDASTYRPTGIPLNKTSFDLGELVKEVADYFSDVNISFDLEENITGSWDRFRIEQVIHNFLTNAVKYSGNSRINIQVFSRGPWASIVVEDEGPGIHLDDQQKIFKRFERAVSGKKVGGLGLGLFIVEQIVSAHNGEVRIDSEIGKGAKFTVKLPYSQPETLLYERSFSENQAQFEQPRI